MTHHDTNALETTSLLDELARACRADEHGFRAAADLVEREELAGLLRELAERRAGMAARLEAAIEELGGEPTPSTPDAGWLAAEDLVGADDPAILAACQRNEETTVARFREAVAAEDLPEELRDRLDEWRAELAAAPGRLQGLELAAHDPGAAGAREDGPR